MVPTPPVTGRFIHYFTASAFRCCQRGLFTRLSLALVTGMVGINAYPEIVADIDFHYYTSSPRSLQTFMEDVSSNSGNPLWAGTTRWHIDFRYDFVESETDCRFTDIKVNLRIRYRMPKLGTPHRDPAITRTFNRYYKQLMEHEEGHGDSGRLAALNVHQLLSEANGENCVALVEQSRWEANKIIKAHRRRDRRYDLITDHGRRQERLTPGMLETP